MFKTYLSLLLTLTLVASADEALEQRLNNLESLMAQFQQELKAKDQTIKELRKQVKGLDKTKSAKITTPSHNHNHAECNSLFGSWDKSRNPVGEKETNTSDVLAQNLGFDEINLGLTFNAAAGAGDLRDSELEEFQGGGHSPQKRGVSLQEFSLSFEGTIENAFDLSSSIAFTEDDTELEEAYITSNSLPYDLTLKLGYFFTDFGLHNRYHVHSWTFVDQPIINSRLFGGEGQRAPGVQLNWLSPLPWYSEFILAIQSSDNEYSPSFKGEAHSHGSEEEHEDEGFEEAVAGRPFAEDENSDKNFSYLLRWTNQFNINENLRAHIGASTLFGENHTGGDTAIYGIDWVLEWEKEGYTRPFLTWQTELMKREYEADSFNFVDNDTPANSFSLDNEKVEDWGLYSQVTHNINNKWAVGFRYEYVSGSGDNFEGEEREGRDSSLDRADRQRFSPMVSYNPSPNSKITLQYNHDQSDVDESSEGNMLWLGFQLKLGQHSH